MPADPCLVTVRAGPAASKGYENFVANKLKDEVLKEITSNLEDDLKEEALNAFKETVADGWSIKDCICKVHNEVLPKVPNERNKFFIKFTFDNQLQIEIGVNKFKNGNAQFYHSIGMATKESPVEDEEEKEERERRREVLEELTSESSCPSIQLKKQTTNDKSSPIVSGKVANPGGGWDDVPEHDVTVPPNPTNMQTALACTGWLFNPPCQTQKSRRRALGDLFRNEKPRAATLRCRSVGRAVQEDRPEQRHRSISPFSHVAKSTKSPFDFTTGIIRSKAKLRPAGSHTVHRGSFKTGRRFSISKENKEIDDNSLQHVEIHVEKEHCPYQVENEKCEDDFFEMRDVFSSSDESIRDEDRQEKSEAFSPEPTCTTDQEFAVEDDEKVEDKTVNQKNVWFITNVETKETYKKLHECEPECKMVDIPSKEEYPIKSIKNFKLPDQSIFQKKIQPLPPLEEFEKWHMSVKDRPQPLPTISFPKLPLSSKGQTNGPDQMLRRECGVSELARGL